MIGTFTVAMVRRFVSAILDAGLESELRRDGAFTLFLPTNEAFDQMSESLRGSLEAQAGNPLSPVLLYHLLDGKLTTKEMRADQLVETRSGAQLRLSKYSNQMTTVNCNPLIRRDQKATNGVLHLIGAVLDPSTISSSSVVDLVIQDGRFNILTDALEKSGYIQELRRMPNALTIMAPSDEAFQKLPEKRLEKILSDKAARHALLKNHVVPHPVCKSAVIGEHKMRTDADNKVAFNCDKKSVFVERAQMSQEEMSGQNGVVHVLDELLIPDRAMNFLELAEKYSLLTFLSLVRVAGLEEAFGDFGDYTLFVPNENAFLAVSESVMEKARSDPEAARQLLLFHGTQGRILSNGISDGQVEMSLDEENPLRLQVHRSALAVENGIIQRADIEAQNGVLHIIDRVLLPSNKTIEEILREKGEFSFFLAAMERASAYDAKALELQLQGVATVFAPTDTAFRALGQTQMDAILNDRETLLKTVKNHVSTRILSSGSFQPDLTYQVATKQGSVDLRREGNQFTVDGVRVREWDITNANGILHLIDGVLVPRERRQTAGGHGYISGSGSSSSSSSSSSSRRVISTNGYKKTVISHTRRTEVSSSGSTSHSSSFSKVVSSSG
ncbi:Periostin [Amphibalanus amphitrite]|uniref:Periostin n=1 Tax=Amphibalanus amphitrite TaxID=1232801 RepID=A0A6A4VW96_AMPAM|nr:Periostin [Amphibalanus amphitrite]